jgi:hypothetical protein
MSTMHRESLGPGLAGRPRLRAAIGTTASLTIHAAIVGLVGFTTWLSAALLGEVGTADNGFDAAGGDSCVGDGWIRCPVAYVEPDIEYGWSRRRSRRVPALDHGRDTQAGLTMADFAGLISDSDSAGDGDEFVAPIVRIAGERGFGTTLAPQALGLIGNSGANRRRRGPDASTDTGLGGSGAVFGVGSEGPAPASIVYVVDRSGSMDAVGDFLKNEIAKAVNRLNSTRTFNVVWFSDDEPEAFRETLVRATEDNKQRLYRHLGEMTFRGSTDPRAAIVKAFQLKPEVIVILTDGNFEPDFVAALNARNTARIRIHAVRFTVPGPDGHSSLIRLTEQNRGKFRAVDPAKLLAD